MSDFPVNFTKTDFDDNLEGLYHKLRRELAGDPSTTEDDLIHQTECYRATKSSGSRKSGGKKKSSSSSPSKISEHIELSQDVSSLLAQLKNGKLVRLYKSICKISLSEHPVLAYVGAWTLLECLATNMGNKSDKSFEAFYNEKLNQSITDRSKRSEIRTPIKDIHSKGNANKHGGVYEAIDARQLISDFKAMEPFLKYCVDKVLNDEL